MTYYIDIFSPETYEHFSSSDKSVAGFTINKKASLSGVKIGDRLICYVTKLSRWVGVLEIVSDSYVDETPRFTVLEDPYSLRVKVKPLVWLSLNQAIPIIEDMIWNKLSFTKDYNKDSSRWTIAVRRSLAKMQDEDGSFLEKLMLQQIKAHHIYPLTAADIKKIKAPTVKTSDNRQVTVSIPENDKVTEVPEERVKQRESIRIQAHLARIGERMRMKIWIPRSDKQRVLEEWKPENETSLLNQLPLNYDDATLKTIENIDVLWIRGRSIIRAFEVEHTTSIYSGILRMADLMALQPNLNIKAHIVAPIERRDKVFEELTRPVFTYLEKGPLQDSCTFISYDSVLVLSKERMVEYMTDNVLEEYAEYASDDNN